MSKQCVIFDNDGVVGNSPEMFSEWYSREHNFPLEKMIPFFTSRFQECMTGHADLKQELKQVLPSWGWNQSVDEFMELWFDRESSVDSSVVALVQDLKSRGFVCCMATNQEKYRLEYLRNHVFHNLFDQVYCSAEIGVKKKDPKFWEFVCKEVYDRYGLGQKNMFFTDDEEENVSVASQFIAAHQYKTLDGFKLFLSESSLQYK